MNVSYATSIFLRALSVTSLALLMSCGSGGDDGAGSPAVFTKASYDMGGSSPPAPLQAQTPAPAASIFVTTLSGTEETPPNNSTALGVGTVTVDTATKTFTATARTTGITGTVAHIHDGAPGVAGPIVIPLAQTAPGSGIWSTTGTLTDEQLAKLRSGAYYFNVHSTAFPNGEIRGQITLPQLNATLSGAQETPPNNSTASGSGTVTVDTATKAFTATAKTTGITGTAAHIHDGAPGVAGPIVIPLAQTAPGSGIWSTTGTLTDEQLAKLRSGAYYFNVHSTAFPNGEIRGQISLPQLNATLSGAEETPPNSSTASGSGTVTMDLATKAFTATARTTGITGTAAHIHDGAPGVAGPIVIPLSETPPGSGTWSTTGTLTDDQLVKLVGGAYYFNVHSVAFPNGEIRGQITRSGTTR